MENNYDKNEWYTREVTRLRDKFCVALESSDSASADIKYVRNQVMRYNDVWWKNWLEDMASPEPQQRQHAMAEYNKLQMRCMPLAVNDDGAEGITVNVVNYNKVETAPTNPPPPIVDVL